MMTKRKMIMLSLWLVLCLGLLPTIEAMGAPVSRETAERAAWYYLWIATPPEVQGGRDAMLSSARELRSDRVDRVVAYVFNIEPRGFFVISADTALVPLIAYSGDSDFGPPEDETDPLVDLLLGDLARRLEAVAAGGAPNASLNERAWDEMLSVPLGRSSSFELAAQTVSSADRRYEGTGQVIAFPNDWHQGAPFNAYCPAYPEGSDIQCKTGCVALAIAQVVAYHRCPTELVLPAQTKYSLDGVECELKTDTCFSLRYPANETSAPDDDVVASLCVAVGQSIHTNYGVMASAANLSEAAEVLTSVWGFASAIPMSLNYFPGVQTSLSSGAFLERLRSESMESYPTILSLSGESSRHAAVCDGWEKETSSTCAVHRFHLRLGGIDCARSAWYHLPIEYPAGYTCVLYGLFSVRAPATCRSLPTEIGLRVNKGCGGVYQQDERIEILYSLPEIGEVALVDFEPGASVAVKTVDLGIQSSGTHSLAARVKGRGVEVVVIRVGSSHGTDMAACLYTIDAPRSLLGAATVATQRGCDAVFLPGERLSITYSVSIPIDEVWIYLVTSQGVRAMAGPLSSASGTAMSDSTIAATEGDRMVVLVATTPQGMVGAVCRYSVR